MCFSVKTTVAFFHCFCFYFILCAKVGRFEMRRVLKNESSLKWR